MSERPSVLIIDDDADELEELRDMVVSLGYRCVAAGDGGEGVALACRDGDIGIVVLDLYMPGMHGVEVLKQIRADARANPRLQSLLVTGRPVVEDAIEGLDLGAVTVLVKPVSMAQLKTNLAEASGRYYGHPGSSDRIPRTGFRAQIQALMEVHRRMAFTNTPPYLAQNREESISNWASAFSFMRAPASVRREDVPEELWFFLRLAERLGNLHTALGGRNLSIKAIRILSEVVKAHVQGRKMSVSALCVAADMPQTTSLRYIEELLDMGLVERCPDACDKRRFFITLTPVGQNKLATATTDFLRLERPTGHRKQLVGEQ